MIANCVKVYKAKIIEVVAANSIILHLQIGKDGSESIIIKHSLPSNPEAAKVAMIEKLGKLFSVKTDSVQNFKEVECYVKVTESWQLNNTILTQVKQFITEEEYNSSLHLNEQPSPTPVSEEEWLQIKQEHQKKTLTKTTGKTQNKKKEKTAKPKKPAPVIKQQSSSKQSKHEPTMAELIAMEQKEKAANNHKPVAQTHPISKKTLTLEDKLELSLVKQNGKRATRPGLATTYAFAHAIQACSHKNNISIKNFR